MAQPVKKLPAVMKHEGSVMCSQNPTIASCPGLAFTLENMWILKEMTDFCKPAAKVSFV
jgi:hypothetical protein